MRVTEYAMNAIVGRAARRIDDAIGHAVSDPQRAQRVNVLLDELAQYLL